MALEDAADRAEDVPAAARIGWVERSQCREWAFLYLLVAPGVSPPALDDPVPLKDVEPLGEPLAPPVPLRAMPDVPGPVPIIAAPFGVIALFLSFAAAAPDVERSPAVPPELWANAKVLVNASAPASAIVETFMVVTSRFLSKTNCGRRLRFRSSSAR
jgi:hypothetical protein